jgi:predicted metalloprotease with PDZ domain
VVRLEKLADLGGDFVLVRLLKIAGADLNVFDFDFDLTWAGFFISADEVVYGRYGGRDAASPDGRLSLPGLRHAMRAALAAHRGAKAATPPKRAPQRVEDYPAARRLGKGCIHCHQVNELRRADRKKAGTWKREAVWAYPLPENVGLVLEVGQGDRVRSVLAGSAAARAGLRAGDAVRSVNGVAVAAQADFQYGLHRAPWAGKVPIAWERGGKALAGTLELAPGWKKTNITWRTSLLDVLPAITVYGDDLSAGEKKALGLGPRRLAFRQDATVHAQARAAGVRGGDVIVGLDGEEPDMTRDEFLAHVRRNYLVGDRVTLHVLRAGKRLRLPMTLR